ncbi:MAG TPA: transporter substrate-binding domain-containing protein [Bordetella sp.]
MTSLRTPIKAVRTSLCLGLLACATLLASTAQAQTALDDILKAKEIQIGIPTDFPPYGSMGTDMTPHGLDVDMAGYIASKLGVKIDLVPVSSNNRVAYLQTKKVSLVISTLGKSPDREKVIDFTAAYSPFFIGVFGPKSIAVKTPADLAGKTIAVTTGAVDDDELTKVAPSGANIRRFSENAGTVAAYSTGQTQLIAANIATASAIMSQNPQLNTEYKFGLKDSPNFIGVAKGEDTLRMKVNEIIAQARQNGDLDKLSLKWLGKPAGDLPQ